MTLLLLIVLSNPALRLLNMTTKHTGYGTKSVIISPDQSKVYALNLEDMSVDEFNRKTKRIERILRFKKTPGIGYNYQKNVWIHSYQEKPVEACFTRNGRYLWISLHNAGGVVVWDLMDSTSVPDSFPYKKVFIRDIEKDTSYSRKLPFYETGKTPKIMVTSRDEKYLFVSNWHSSTVSVLDISSPDPFQWRKIRDITTGRLPRGLAVSEDNKLLYIAQMGSDAIKMVEIGTWQDNGLIHAAVNPRHLFINGDFLYVSINIGAEIMKIALGTNRIVKASRTDHLARTLALSPSGKYAFVVCYSDNILDVFDTDSLVRIGRFKTGIHPVGVATYQNGDTIEAWVCDYSGKINIFTFLDSLNTTKPDSIFR